MMAVWGCGGCSEVSPFHAVESPRSRVCVVRAAPCSRIPGVGLVTESTTTTRYPSTMSSQKTAGHGSHTHKKACRRHTCLRINSHKAKPQGCHRYSSRALASRAIARYRLQAAPRASRIQHSQHLPESGHETSSVDIRQATLGGPARARSPLPPLPKQRGCACWPPATTG